MYYNIPMDLQTHLFSILGIGPSIVKKLARLNLLTVEDLIHHYPFRYDDFSHTSNALEAQIGQKVTLVGEIWSIKAIYTRSRKVLVQAIFNDGTSPITLTWFNQGWLTKSIQTGDRLQVSGKLSKYKNKLSIIAPVWEKINQLTNQMSNIHTGRLVPIYPETDNLSSKWLRTKISQILPEIKNQITDPLPDSVKDNMLALPEALSKIHFPDSWEQAQQARDRLGFDELFYVTLATLKMRAQWQDKKSVEVFKIDPKDLKTFIEKLPFHLTKAQEKVISEIIADLKKGYPANRLIQGEVGSGKTVVATAIAYLTHRNGFKTILMAPTEILAFQHFSTMSALLTPFGIKVGIYTGSKKQADDADVFVGTHALLSEKLKTQNVGLIIIDEQQRFGVAQRSLLRSKASIPHFLTMTATPIPRTVALTLYGDLDISLINEMPKGRKVVKTYLVPEKKRQDSYQFIAKKVKEGDQVYVITPLIDFSETSVSAKAAKVEYERLRTDIFPNLKIGLLHGKLKPKEKEQAINDFKDKKVDILVSTSVVEVGVDVPNATIMLIEGAERFGLAQLHQLRGRVGRGEKESYCLMFTQDSKQSSRLKNLENIYDGMKLAELDLKIRGSGELFGTRQSGRLEFKIASLSDLTLIEKTRAAASKILNEDPTVDKYPLLKAKLLNLGSNVMPD